MTLHRLAGSLLVILSLSSVAWAHPGHGQPGPAHYVTDPDHLLISGILAAATGTLLWMLLAKRPSRAPRR